MNSTSISLLANLFGLFFDLLGFILLLKLAILPYKKINDTRRLRRYSFGEFNANELADEIAKNLNTMIDDINAKNDERRKKSILPLWMIMAGSILHIISTIISMVHIK